MKMNKLFAMALPLCVGALLAGCNDAATEEEIAPVATTHTITAIIDNDVDDTRAYVGGEDKGNKVLWNTGDQISFFPAGQTSPQVATLVGNGGNDYGSFTYESNQPASGSECFGVFPYNSKDKVVKTEIQTDIQTELPTMQTYHKGSQGGYNVHMTAFTGNDGNEDLTFQTYSSGLCIKLTGSGKGFKINVISEGTDNKGLAGKIKIEVPYKEKGKPVTYPVAATMATNNTVDASTVTLDCSDVELTSEPQEFWVALLPGTYEKLRVQVTNINGNEVYFNKTASNRTFTRGMIKTIGKTPIEANVVNEVPVVDLSKKGVANCYIVSNAGTFSFSVASRSNSATPNTEDNVEASLMWSTNANDANADASLHNITDIRYDASEKRIYFTVKEFIPGSALITAHNKTQNTIHNNWHIWLTDQPKDMTLTNGTVMMDRNLGAISTDPNDLNSAGFLYQFSRQDPLYNSKTGSVCNKPIIGHKWSSKLSDGWKIANATMTEKKEYHLYPTNILYYDFYDPKDYYNDQDYRLDNNVNWYDDWLLGYSDNWDATREYDPCPAGYKVPSYSQLQDANIAGSNSGFETTTSDICYIPKQNYFSQISANSWSFKQMGNPGIWVNDKADYIQDGCWQLDAYSIFLEPEKVLVKCSNYYAGAYPVRCVKE